MDQEIVFTTTEAAHILKFSVSKTYKLVEAGILVGTKYGGVYRFTMQQLLNPVNPTPEEKPNGRLRRQTKRKLLLPVRV